MKAAGIAHMARIGTPPMADSAAPSSTRPASTRPAPRGCRDAKKNSPQLFSWLQKLRYTSPTAPPADYAADGGKWHKVNLGFLHHNPNHKQA